MIKIKKKRSPFTSLLLSLLLCLAMFMPVSVMSASADEAGEDTPHSVEAIIENTTFVAFRKSDLTSKYKYSIFACYYVPDSVFESTYTYGVVIFPKFYADKYGLTSDYLQKAEEQNVLIMDIVSPGQLQGSNGRIFKCGIVEMMEHNLSREFAFIFYAKDTEGNIEYTPAQFAMYNTLDARDFTDAELLEMVEGKIQTENSFRAILDKITELVDAVWYYVVLGMAGIVTVWGGYIGIRVIIAKKNDEKINARGMLKNLVIGIIVMFSIAVVVPMLMNGLMHWVAW